MKLISETGGSRIWELEDGTHREQRIQLFGLSGEMAAKTVDEIPAVGAAAAEMLVNRAQQMVAELGEPLPDGEMREERYMVQPLLYDEAGEPVQDEDGDYVEDPDAEPFEISRLTVEFGYWPKMEEESDE